MNVAAAMSRKCSSPNKDTVINIRRESHVSSSSIKPEEGAILDPMAVVIHGLHENHENIMNADDVETAWARFRAWFHQHVHEEDNGSVGCVKWGDPCLEMAMEDNTDSPQLPNYLPEQIECFIDPLKVIRHYKRCKLNSNNSRLDNYKLGVVWAYIHNEQNLNGAYDSLIDKGINRCHITSEFHM